MMEGMLQISSTLYRGRWGGGEGAVSKNNVCVGNPRAPGLKLAQWGSGLSISCFSLGVKPFIQLQKKRPTFEYRALHACSATRVTFIVVGSTAVVVRSRVLANLGVTWTRGGLADAWIHPSLTTVRPRGQQKH